MFSSSSVRRLAVTAVIATVLAACSTPYSPPVILDRDTRFPGLIDLAAQAQGQGQAADVLLVHGICTHDATWAAQVVAQLLPSLTAATAPPAPTFANDPSAIEIVPSTVSTPAGQLRFNALIWSPLTTPLKRQLCYDQTDKSPICEGAPPYPLECPAEGRAGR